MHVSIYIYTIYKCVCSPSPSRKYTAGPPPLPIIEESIAVARFIVTGVDDVVEDAVKLACTALVFSSATAVTKRLRGGLAPAAPQPREGEGEGAGWQTQLQWNPVGFAAAIAAYPICDAAGDKLGDGAEIARDRVMKGFGLTPPARNTKPPGTTTAAAELQGYLAPILDDLIEDSFKGVCLGMHGVIGSALGTQLLQGSLGSWLPWLPLPAKTAAAAVLTYGTPLKQYTECNAWGDTFGDLAVAKLKVWGNSSSAPSTRTNAPARRSGTNLGSSRSRSSGEDDGQEDNAHAEGLPPLKVAAAVAAAARNV